MTTSTDTHHLRLVVDYVFSQLRSAELTEEVLRTLHDVAREFPVSVFATVVHLWGKASSVQVGHKQRLCRAFSEAILPHCQPDSLHGLFPEVKQLVSLVLNFADETETHDACLQRLAAVDGGLFALVSEQIFARLSVKDVSYAVPLVSLRKIAACFPSGVKTSQALWFTNVLACLSGGVCVDKGDVMALADLCVAIIEATGTGAAEFPSSHGNEQLLVRIFECFYDLVHRHAADVSACVCFLNVLAALAPSVPPLSLQIRREQVEKLFLSVLRIFVTVKIFDAHSETLLKFLAALKKAQETLLLQSVHEALFPLLVRFVASDDKNSPAGALAVACLLSEKKQASEQFVYAKAESRREEEKAAAIWLASELARSRGLGTTVDGRFCDPALASYPKSSLVLAASLEFARVVGVVEVSEKLLLTILDRATGDGASSDEAAFNVALSFKESPTRMWQALWPRLLGGSATWRVCALINVVFDKTVCFLPEEHKARVVLWLLISLSVTSGPDETAFAQKRALAETYAKLAPQLVCVGVAGGGTAPETATLMSISWETRGASVELEQMFEQLKTEQPDQLVTLFNAVLAVLGNFDLLQAASRPERVKLEWLRLFGVTLAFSPTETVIFAALDKLLGEHVALLEDEDARMEVGHIFAQVDVRFPDQTRETLARLWTQAENMRNQNSFLAIFQPQNAVHAVYMQGVVAAARAISGCNEHLRALLDDLTINAVAEGATVADEVVAVLSRAISERQTTSIMKADKSYVERLTGFFIARMQNAESPAKLARPCLLALAGLLEVYADRKFALEISVLSETLSAVLRVLLVEEVEDVEDVAGNFHAAGRLFVGLLAVSESPEVDSPEEERIAVSWRCLSSLMQTVSTVIGNISVLRVAAFHLLDTLTAAAPARMHPEISTEAWGVCVAVVWGGMGEAGAEISESAMKAVRNLLRRHAEFENCSFQLGEVAEIGKKFVKTLQLGETQTQTALVAVTKEVAQQTIGNSGSRTSGNLLLEILNRAEALGARYCGELASELFEKNGHGNFLFLRKLLKKNFDCVFDTLFLTQPLSSREDRKYVYVSALHETCRDRRFMLQALAMTAHALTNTELAEPRQEALELVETLFAEKYVNLEVSWLAQKFFASLVVACLMHVDKFPTLARRCVENLARHNLIEIKAPHGGKTSDWSVETQRLVRIIIDGRPEVARELLDFALRFAEPRPEHTLALVISLAENSEDYAVVSEAKTWLWNFPRVRESPELTLRVRKIHL